MRRHEARRFLNIKTEGGLLPAEFLERIAAEDAGIPGLGSQDYRLLPHERLAEGAERSWTYLQSAWQSFRDALEKLPDNDHAVRLTRERWLRVLFRELGYGSNIPRTRAVEVDGKSYALSHIWENRCPVHMLGYRVPLDTRTKNVPGAAKASPHGLLQEFLNRSDDHLWGFVSNGRILRLLRDHHSLTRQAYVEFDLEAIFDGVLFSEFLVLWLVGHATRIDAERPEASIVESWFKQSRDEGVRALDKLRDGVEKAITALGRGFLRRSENTTLHAALESGELDKQEYYHQLLRLVYRLIFLFVAEDRDVLLDPNADDDARERYRQFYATDRLRRLSLRRRTSPYTDLWQGLRLVMKFLNEGRAELALPALDSYLWRDESVSWLIDAEIGNEDLMDAVYAVGYTEERHVRMPVAWKSLGSEELGSIYESLLEQHPQIHRETATFELKTAAGHERKTTGSYYTPTSLVNCLLDSALDPVLDEAAKEEDPEEAILNLKVCDPACGSGHFLVAAARRISQWLANVRSGDEEPSPQETQKALRDVVGRCIYGVDINPMAVELCKVSLWMEALEPGKPLSFLDHHIQTGNSLLGATPRLLQDGIPSAAFTVIYGDDKAFCRDLRKRNEKERSGQRSLFAQGRNPMERFGDLQVVLNQIEEIDDSTVEGIRQKEFKWNKIQDSRDYLYGRMWTDAWCAAFVWNKVDVPKQPVPITEEYFRDMELNPERVLKEDRMEIRRLAKQYKFFHWHLAFPDIFWVPENIAEASNTAMGWDGGFDVVIGNPPWDQIQFNPKEYFAHIAPEIAAARHMKARSDMIADLELSAPDVFVNYLAAKRSVDGIKSFVHNSGRYPLTSHGRLNSSSLFCELGVNIIGPGQCGMIVPSGIITDSFNRHFTQHIIKEKRLVSVFDFENVVGLFPGVGHGRFRFCLITIAQADQRNRDPEFAFFAHQPEDLTAERVFRMKGEDIAIFNPNTGTCPVFKTRRDATINIQIYNNIPVLVRDQVEGVRGGSPWMFQSNLMFMMNTASHLFEEAKVLELLPDNTTALARDDRRYVRLYEAKMASFYDHRAGDYADYPEGAETTILPDVPQQRLINANYAVQPRHWIPEAEVDGRIAEKWGRRWFFGWRDITHATNWRSTTAVILPYSGVGHTITLGFVGSEFVGLVPIILSNFNSFAFDYIARQKIGGLHLSFHLVKQLPAIPPDIAFTATKWATEITMLSWLSSRAIELTYTAWDLQPFAQDVGYDGPPFKWDEDRRQMLRAELDAAFFHLYEINRDDVDYIMETFPIVKKKDWKKYGDFRTKEMILHVYDAMQKAMDTGEPYQTMLDPPPADPRVAHPPRGETSDAYVAPVVPFPSSPSVEPPSAVPPSPPEVYDPLPEERQVAEPDAPYFPADAPAAVADDEWDESHSSVLDWLEARPGWHGRAAILDEVGLSVGEWNRVIQNLVDSGEVEKTGVRRGTRYRLAAAAAVGEGSVPVVESASVSESASASGDVGQLIIGWMSEHPGWHGRAEVLEAVEIDVSAWNHAIADLVETGEVERQGEKRGTRYRWRGDDRQLVAWWFEANPGWHSRAVIVGDLEIDAGSWNRAINDLVASGEVVKKGEKRGTRYRWAEHEELLLF